MALSSDSRVTEMKRRGAAGCGHDLPAKAWPIAPGRRGKNILLKRAKGTRQGGERKIVKPADE